MHCVSLRSCTLNFTLLCVKAGLRFQCAVRTWDLVIISTILQLILRSLLVLREEFKQVDIRRDDFRIRFSRSAFFLGPTADTVHASTLPLCGSDVPQRLFSLLTPNASVGSVFTVGVKSVVLALS